jgi:Yip1-like protein
MSEAAPVVPVAPVTPDAPEAPLGFVPTLVGLYTAPTETFRAVARRPAWVVPFLAIIAINVAFTFVWLRKADPVELSRAQMEEAGVFDRVPADQHEAIVQRQAHLLPIFAWLGPTVFAPIVFALLALAFMFVFRFFYASETTFKQSLAVVSWSVLAVALVSTPLTLLILSLRGEWSVDPRTVLQANPAAFFDKGAVSKPVHALLDALDLFSAWTLFLYSAGYAATARRSVGSAAVGVVVLWAGYVAVKVALAFVF